MGTAMRRVASLVGLAVLVLLALGYRSLPGWSPAAVPPPEVHAVVPEFHRFDRAEVPGLDAADGPCGTCHPAAAHQRSAAARAFLNLHRRSLDCGVCHLRGKGLVVRHFRDAAVVTADTLTAGPYGRVYAAVRAGDGWRRLQAPGNGAVLRPVGPGCRDCHRRGSTLLATDGLVDTYRRRVLEDLSVLRFLGGDR
ncbi:MAG: hypothetical protein P1P84_11040 [Deferrisomatales bacterium]|nr:hypothetical protein [Deferrisomatales bacterium]